MSHLEFSLIFNLSGCQTSSNWVAAARRLKPLQWARQMVKIESEAENRDWAADGCWGIGWGLSVSIRHSLPCGDGTVLLLGGAGDTNGLRV